MADEDELIGRNVARFREPRSQSDVAKAMRARGWKWAQNTVSAVEQGERPLRLAEALDLASILEVRNVDAFARESEYVTFKLWAGEVYQAHLALVAAAERYREAQVQLASAADVLVATGVEQTGDVALGLDWLRESPTDVIIHASLNDDDPDATATRAFVASVREGREQRGGNGPWMNVLFDTRVREAIEALADLDNENRPAMYRDLSGASDEDFEREVLAVFG